MKEKAMDLRGKRVLVVGLGKTGEATVRFLLEKGALVQVSEKRPASEFGSILQELRTKGVKVETGGHNRKTFLGVDLIIPSPGVPRIPEIKAAEEKGIRVMAEIELAASFIQGKIIGITGTNGKSTTTALTYKILKGGKYRVHLAGNIGVPLIKFAPTSKANDVYVTEISSFQLEFCEHFRADVAVLLNLSPNHLDWHGSFEAYFAAKKKLFTNLTSRDIAILNRDDPLVWPLRREMNASSLAFSQSHRIRRGTFLLEDWVVLRHDRIVPAIPLRSIKLRGAHNLDNVMAAVLVGHLFNVPLPEMRRVIRNFAGLEHRLERVLTLRGITFYNDSKATTVDATMKALTSFDQTIILIMGGRDKGADFSLLRPLVQRRVRHLILLGEASEKIRQALEGTTSIKTAKTMGEAVSLAFEAGRRGDVILLSPACTSFDLFANFEHRGRVFKREVRRLARSVKGDRKS